MCFDHKHVDQKDLYQKQLISSNPTLYESLNTFSSNINEEIVLDEDESFIKNKLKKRGS